MVKVMHFEDILRSLLNPNCEKFMAKIDKSREIPKFLLDKQYLFGSVVFVLTFSFVFMAVYTPFSYTVWFSLTDMRHLLLTAVFYVGALLIMSASKRLLYRVQNRVRFTFAKYIAWLLAEVVAISLFYTLFTSVFIAPFEQPVWMILLKAVWCVLMIMAIPYTIQTLYAAYRAKTEELQMLQYEMSLGGEPTTVTYPSLINLYDYNGTLKLTISADSLYYMESQDNYVKIFYMNHGKLMSYMLRCRTKSIEENLAETSMVRCHRSYMVNVMKINNIRKKGKARYVVLDNSDIKPIPVSKSYFKNLIGKIERFNASGRSVTETTDVSETVAAEQCDAATE